MIPESQWQWFGRAGHFISAHRCRFHLHTHVGRFCISTVGDLYYDRDQKEPSEIGSGYLYETMVFDHTRAEDAGRWEQIAIWSCNDSDEADRLHMEFCRKFAEEETA